MKVMHLRTSDGVGLLAYAGLGATPRGTQPSEWMSAVLRGRGDLSFEHALLVLAAAAIRELPSYISRTPGKSHTIIVPAFVTDVGPRLYTIDNFIDEAGDHWHRQASHHRSDDPGSPSARVGLGGSGGDYLSQKGWGWQRALLSLVNAHDRGKVSDRCIADELARINCDVHHGIADGSVGPRCVVAWRRRPNARHNSSGSGHLFYSGVSRDRQTPAIPGLMHGADVKSIGEAFMAPRIAGSGLEFDYDEVNRRLAEVGNEPDENLR